ncbi:MAG: hypothetical protein J3K34DRAFT_398774 [Monoraphidium minutum]|nr:MAG: hypothetical protein J3K34DRAFT_398774 [Monoraphidium minutum]
MQHARARTWHPTPFLLALNFAHQRSPAKHPKHGRVGGARQTASGLHRTYYKNSIQDPACPCVPPPLRIQSRHTTPCHIAATVGRRKPRLAPRPVPSLRVAYARAPQSLLPRRVCVAPAPRARASSLCECCQALPCRLRLWKPRRGQPNSTAPRRPPMDICHGAGPRVSPFCRNAHRPRLHPHPLALISQQPQRRPAPAAHGRRAAPPPTHACWVAPWAPCKLLRRAAGTS